MAIEETNSALLGLVELHRGAGQAVHRQLEEALRSAIRAGRLAPGTRLPPTRQLAADLGCSRGVVVEAYAQLVAEGYLIARTGSATRVAAAMAAPVARQIPTQPPEPGPPMAFDFRPGSPDLGGFPRTAWSRALQHAARDVAPGDLGYGDVRGHLAARMTLAGWLTRTRAALAAPADLLVTSGFTQGAGLAVRALQRHGITELAVEDPGHPEQRVSLRRQGMALLPIPVDSGGIVVDALASSPARAVLVTPAHQFPTGAALSPARRAALLAWARASDGTVIEDDYDAEYRYDRAPVGCLQGLAPDRVVYAGSASKILAPGLRLGWLLVPPWLAGDIIAEKNAADHGSPVLSQLALAAFIDSGGLDRHLRHSRVRYRTSRDRLVTALARHIPSATVGGIAAGLHAVVELAGADPDLEPHIERRARSLGVGVHGMHQYRSARAGAGPPSLVVGYSRLPEHRIDEGIARLAAAVDAARRPR